MQFATNEPRLDLTAGGINATLNDLAAPIRLLSPALTSAARDGVVGLTLFLDDIQKKRWGIAEVEDPSVELNLFEAAAAADLASIPQGAPQPEERKRRRRVRA